MRPLTGTSAEIESITLPREAVAGIAGLRKWAPSGVLALLDQGLISGSNFVLGVCLARLAGPEPYGAYMLMFAAFLLIANVYQALVLEPANVLGFSLFPGRRDRYLRAILWMHSIFTRGFLIAGGLVFLAAPHLNMSPLLSSALTGFVAAAPCVLLYWMARCFAYLDMSPATAVSGSIVYCAVLAASTISVWAAGLLSPRTIFLATALAALAGSARMLYSRLPWGAAAEDEPTPATVWRCHWSFGRWGLGSVGLSWAQTNSMSFISGGLLGLHEVGGLNALVGLLLPMFQVLTSATRLALPRIAQIFTVHGMDATRRPVIRVAVVLVALASAYALLISALHAPIFERLYGARFVPYAWMVPIISLHLVAWAVITACDIAFISIQLPQAPFRIKLALVAVMIPASALLTWRGGLLWAIIAVPAFSTLTAVLMSLKLRAVWNESNKRQEAEA